MLRRALHLIHLPAAGVTVGAVAVASAGAILAGSASPSSAVERAPDVFGHATVSDSALGHLPSLFPLATPTPRPTPTVSPIPSSTPAPTIVPPATVAVVHRELARGAAPQIVATPATAVRPVKAATGKTAPVKVATTKTAPPAAKPAPVASTPAPAQLPSLPALAAALLGRLNADRAANGVGPLSISGSLVQAAHAHNLAMAAANTMSHQVSGEASLLTRLSSAGYAARTAGENIGWTTNNSQAGVLGLDNAMMAEVAPNNGHRVNILNSAYTQVGIDVLYDAATGRLWLTEDFGAPR